MEAVRETVRSRLSSDVTDDERGATIVVGSLHFFMTQLPTSLVRNYDRDGGGEQRKEGGREGPI